MEQIHKQDHKLAILATLKAYKITCTFIVNTGREHVHKHNCRRDMENVANVLDSTIMYARIPLCGIAKLVH